MNKKVVSSIIEALCHMSLFDEEENYEFSFIEEKISDWESELTLRHICSKHLVKWKHPPCIFAVLMRIYDHDVPIFIDMVYNRLLIKLPR